ncbi:Alpha/Beta hydrolase protein [Aspergillus cavernicola]|uniref:Alpha/Beta hydrolase protein n=1 Tax=Aspergillus cavernicola TaxID=176166 RepID=A0ABR4HNE4_9EURO
MFGQSEGSASLEYYAYAWKEDPIIAGLIQQSGSINHENPSPQEAKAVEDSWFSVANTLGCGNASSDHDGVVECMRTKDMEDILALVPGFAGSSNLTFRPVADEITVFSDLEERTKAGNFIKVPLLMGAVDYETGLTIALDLTDPNATSPTQEYWDNIDEHSMCSVGERANISISHDIPTWRYRYFGTWPNMQLSTYPDSGAWHTIDVLAVFDFFPQGPEIPDENSAQISTGNYIRGAWAAFAKDPQEGLKSYEDGWPLYNPQESTLIRLAYNNQTGANLGRPYPYDKGCNSTFPVDRSEAGIETDSVGPSSTPEAFNGGGRRLGSSLAFAFWAAVVSAFIYN